MINGRRIARDTTLGRVVSLIVVGTVTYAFGGIINTGYSLLVARSLQPSQFAFFSSALTIIGIATMPAIAFQLSTARIAAEDHFRPGPIIFDKPLQALMWISVGSGLSLAIIGVALGILGNSWFSIPFWLIALLPLSLAGAWAMGRLQGLGRIKTLLTLGNIGSVVKLIWLLLLIAFGAVSTQLLFVGLVVAGAVLLIVLVAVSYKRGYLEIAFDRRVLTWLLITSIFVWISSQIDVLLAYRNLHGTVAGNFAAASTLAKGIALVGTVFGTAYLRKYVQAASANSIRLRPLLLVGLGSFTLPGVILVPFWLICMPLLTEWLGPGYEQTSQIFALLGVASLPWAAAISISQLAPLFSGRLAAGSAASVLLTEVLLSSLFGSSPERLSAIYGFSGMLMVIVLTLIAAKRSS